MKKEPQRNTHSSADRHEDRDLNLQRKSDIHADLGETRCKGLSPNAAQPEQNVRLVSAAEVKFAHANLRPQAEGTVVGWRTPEDRWTRWMAQSPSRSRADTRDRTVPSACVWL
ncbi:unnamed protein product [Pleuronectes platessa]|uniref:Uncharacterized protein n=1 Tax=Pleuronectes platessa TaxID=8262 RepID=A0A9N7VVV1_PLEPL|nr:unnamed protein product [Pleuronectes platessa]